jgi:hypothetical protein
MGEIRGSCPAVQFPLRDWIVHTNGSTAYTKGSCKDLKEDRQVIVRGTVQGQEQGQQDGEGKGSLLATSIEVQK